MTRKALFFAKGSQALGAGHLARCVTLADELKARGWQTFFASNGQPHKILPAINNHAVMPMRQRQGSVLAAEILAQIGRVDLCVLDDYGIDERDELPLREATLRIAIIDDLANRRHYCDLLLDQNYGRSHGDYQALVPAGCTILTGPKYALLRSEFGAWRQRSLRRRQEISTRLFVCFGGTDPVDMCLRTARALIDFEMDIVVGPAAQSLSELQELATSVDSLWLHVASKEIAKLMAGAKLAIGAGGLMTWERMALGLPSIIVPFARNQHATANAISRDQLAIVIEPERFEEIHDHVIEIFKTPDRLLSLSKKTAALVDGRGTGRVIEAIENMFKQDASL